MLDVLKALAVIVGMFAVVGGGLLLLVAYGAARIAAAQDDASEW